MNELSRHAEQNTESRPVTFESLWSRFHRPMVWFVTGYLRRMGNGRMSNVDDEVQEIMLKVWQSIGRLDAGRNVTAWVYAVARNHCIDRQRRSRRTPVELNSEAVVDSPSFPGDSDPEELYTKKELRETVGSFVESLDSEDRMILMLRYYEDLPYREISDAVGRPEGTVKYRVHELKNRLRAQLEGA